MEGGRGRKELPIFAELIAKELLCGISAIQKPQLRLSTTSTEQSSTTPSKKEEAVEKKLPPAERGGGQTTIPEPLGEDACPKIAIQRLSGRQHREWATMSSSANEN